MSIQNPVIRDPATQSRDVVSLSRTSRLKALDDLTLSKFASKYARPLWPWYLCGAICLIAVNIIALEIPQLAKQIVDQLSSNQALTTKHTDVALLIIGLGVATILIRTLSRICIFWPGRKLESHFRDDLFDRLLQLPQKFYYEYGFGDIISRMSNDTAHLRAFFAFGALQILNVIFLMTFAISKMWSINHILTILAITPLLLMLFLTRMVMPKMAHYSMENQEKIGRLTNYITETYVNVHVVQASDAASAMMSRIIPVNDSVYESHIKLIIIRTFLFPAMSLLGGISVFAVLVYGGAQAIEGRLTVGDIMAFNVYVGLIAFPLTAIGIILSMFQRAKTALHRISQVTTALPETVNPTTHEPLISRTTSSTIAPLLEVKNLHFSYQDAYGSDEPDRTSSFRLGGKIPVSFTMELKPKAQDSAASAGNTLHAYRKIGIKGPIGSGKTTLLHLVGRILTPPTNTIFYRGIDICLIDPRVYRSKIAYAMQEVHLFSASIKENLLLACKHPETVSETDLIRACKLACIWDEIQEFPQGLATEIGEKGVRLSGGQKQRLALARIFIEKRDLVILDDVLSAVDHQTEDKLIEAIDGLDCTVIIASHRDSVLKHMDHVIDLDAHSQFSRNDKPEDHS